MTLPYSQLQAITNSFIDNVLRDAVFKKNALLVRMSRPGFLKERSGENFKFPVIIGNETLTTTGNFYTGSEALTQDESEDITAAYYSPKQIYESVKLSNIDIAKNQGKEAIIDLIKGKVEVAEKRMSAKMTKALYSDGSSTSGMLRADQFDGLALLMSQDTSVSFGGITPTDLADTAYWLAYSSTNSGTNRAMTINLINAAIGGCTEGNERPTVAVMKQALFDNFLNLLTPYQRLNNSKTMNDLGHPSNNLSYAGVDFIVDNLMTQYYIYFLNEAHLFLTALKGWNMKRVNFSNLESSDAMLTRIHFFGELCCTNRKYQGQLGDLTE